MFVHDIVAWVDVHDVDTAGWLTEHLVSGAVASGLEGAGASVSGEVAVGGAVLDHR
jgi:hypothetical protein